MPWQNAQIDVNHTADGSLVKVRIEFVDALEFVTPFVYSEERLATTTPSLTGFKTRANAARDAERTRRQNIATREAQLVTLMNT